MQHKGRRRCHPFFHPPSKGPEQNFPPVRHNGSSQSHLNSKEQSNIYCPFKSVDKFPTSFTCKYSQNAHHTLIDYLAYLDYYFSFIYDASVFYFLLQLLQFFPHKTVLSNLILLIFKNYLLLNSLKAHIIIPEASYPVPQLEFFFFFFKAWTKLLGLTLNFWV